MGFLLPWTIPVNAAPPYLCPIGGTEVVSRGVLKVREATCGLHGHQKAFEGPQVIWRPHMISLTLRMPLDGKAVVWAPHRVVKLGCRTPHCGASEHLHLLNTPSPGMTVPAKYPTAMQLFCRLHFYNVLKIIIGNC